MTLGEKNDGFLFGDPCDSPKVITLVEWLRNVVKHDGQTGHVHEGFPRKFLSQPALVTLTCILTCTPCCLIRSTKL